MGRTWTPAYAGVTGCSGGDGLFRWRKL